MVASVPERYEGVSVATKANVYFEGRVVSYTVLWPDGTRRSLGVILPGDYQFGTGAPERMDIVAGSCRVRLDGTDAVRTVAAGECFEVPGDSGFDIAVDEGVVEYVCSYG
jgi:uncharacterized protein YaiE (UPF0345 family)